MTSQYFDSNPLSIRNGIAVGLKVNVVDVDTPVLQGSARRSNQTLSYSVKLKVDSPSQFVSSKEANLTQTLNDLNTAFTRYNVPQATSIGFQVISSGLSAGGIAGIVIGSFVGSVLIIFMVYRVFRMRGQAQKDGQSQLLQNNTVAGHSDPVQPETLGQAAPTG
eukprot:412917-Hanusia_phi.AAC.1